LTPCKYMVVANHPPCLEPPPTLGEDVEEG
jgi:hypothetical protein